MASRSLQTRSVTVVLLLAVSLSWLLATSLVTPSAALAQSPSSLGNSNIYPKPYPAPTLPAAGGSFTDPTFGTRIIRVTDPVNAPNGAAVNSAATDSMFNADGSMFYVHITGVESSLYSINKTNGTVARIGRMPGIIGIDGAAWHPTNPGLLYGISVDTQNRKLYEIALPAGTATLLHNFDVEIPAGGYPSPRVQVSSDARYFAVTASTFAGQDNYDYVVVWDRQTNTSKVLNTPVRFGAGTYLHSLEMDNTGQYIRLSVATPQVGSIFWHWSDNTVSTLVIEAAPDYFGGHKVQGASVNLNQGIQGDIWLVRNLQTPHVFSTLITYPRKNGMANWFEDSHASRVLPTGTFFESRYFFGGGTGAFSLVSGSVYNLVGYRTQNGMANYGVPDTVRFGLTNLTNVGGIPTAPGQWSYNTSTDTVYVWLPDSANPQANRSALHIGDWRPMMEEIVQLIPTGGGGWTWQRLAHHQTHYITWETGPRGNASPTGSYILFQSNWGGSPRTDVFLAIVPALSSLSAPSNLQVR